MADINTSSFVIITSRFRHVIIRIRDNSLKVFIFARYRSPHKSYGQKHINYLIFHFL